MPLDGSEESKFSPPSFCPELLAGLPWHCLPPPRISAADCSTCLAAPVAAAGASGAYGLGFRDSGLGFRV